MVRLLRLALFLCRYCIFFSLWSLNFPFIMCCYLSLCFCMLPFRGRRRRRKKKPFGVVTLSRRKRCCRFIGWRWRRQCYKTRTELSEERFIPYKRERARESLKYRDWADEAHKCVGVWLAVYFCFLFVCLFSRQAVGCRPLLAGLKTKLQNKTKKKIKQKPWHKVHLSQSPRITISLQTPPHLVKKQKKIRGVCILESVPTVKVHRREREIMMMVVVMMMRENEEEWVVIGLLKMMMCH